MMETIGNRAYKAICERAAKNRMKPSAEAAKIDISRKNLTDWKKSRNPNAYFLQQMALAGYDVIYILTGEKKC